MTFVEIWRGLIALSYISVPDGACHRLGCSEAYMALFLELIREADPIGDRGRLIARLPYARGSVPIARIACPKWNEA